MAFGLLVLLGTVAGLIWYFLTSSHHATFEIRTRDSISGLIADSPVEFHGVEVGKVKRVQLIDPHTVSILLTVEEEAPITKATVATITARGLATRGFTGYVYVALDDVGTDSRPLTVPPGSSFPLIPTAPSQSKSLDTTISEVKQDVQTLTDLLQSVLDQKTIASLKQSIDNLQQVTQTLTANNKKLDAMISNAERASTNAERASREVKPLLESSHEAVQALQTEVLPEAYDTLLKLHKLSVSLQEITAEIERDPAVLVRGKSLPPPGPGEK